jgi:phage-related protein
MTREIIFYGDYFLEFYNALHSKDQEKVDFVLEFIRIVDRVPSKFLKHLEGTTALYEIRILSRGKTYRIFCFFDEGNIVVLINAFQKKTDKTPKSELYLAEKLRKQYLEDKGTRRT